jgi:hypothetical protein
MTNSLYWEDSGVGNVYCILYLISYHRIRQHVTNSISLNFAISPSLSEALCGSMYCCESSKPSIIVPSHRHSMLLELDLCILTKSFLNAPRGAAECQWWALTILASPFPYKRSPNSDSGLKSSVQNRGNNPSILIPDDMETSNQ